MQHFMRRSLLVQLLSVYLLFVMVVLLAGVGVNAAVEQQLSDDAQASNRALAQEIALQTSLQLTNAEQSVEALGKLALQASTPDEIAKVFQTFQAARSDVGHVDWLDPLGSFIVSCSPNPPKPNPPCQSGIVAEFSPQEIVQRASLSSGPVYDVGIATGPNFNISPGVIIAETVRANNGSPVGIVAVNLSLAQLSVPLEKVVNAQRLLNRKLMISIIDNRGELIATPNPDQYLWNVLNDLPGADQALQGYNASRLSPGPAGQDWLFSSVPVPDAGWAVVVQRPASEALAVVAQFHLWLLFVALLFAIGGLLFWLMLLIRVIRPLHTLAIEHQA